MFFIFSQNTKEDYLKNVGNHIISVPFGLYCYYFCPYNESQRDLILLGYTFFKISSFVFKRRKRLIHVCYFRVSKLWQNCNFCVNYALNIIQWNYFFKIMVFVFCIWCHSSWWSLQENWACSCRDSDQSERSFPAASELLVTGWGPMSKNTQVAYVQECCLPAGFSVFFWLLTDR